MLLTIPVGLPCHSTLQSRPLRLKQFHENKSDRTNVKTFSRLSIIAEAWVQPQASKGKGKVIPLQARCCPEFG